MIIISILRKWSPKYPVPVFSFLLTMLIQHRTDHSILLRSALSYAMVPRTCVLICMYSNIILFVIKFLAILVILQILCRQLPQGMRIKFHNFWLLCSLKILTAVNTKTTRCSINYYKSTENDAGRSNLFNMFIKIPDVS